MFFEVTDATGATLSVDKGADTGAMTTVKDSRRRKIVNFVGPIYQVVRMNCMNDSQEFQEKKQICSGKLSYVPSQPTVVPSPRAMSSRAQSLRSDAWNLSGTQGKRFWQSTCSNRFVRGLHIATGKYSSFGGCALGLMLGVLDLMEVEVQDREQVEVRENVEARETEEGDKNKETTNAQTCDDMWMNMFCADASCDTLSYYAMCAQG